MPVVYKIVSPSGKSYIGVAKRSAQERFKKHCADARLGRKTALCGAIRKYGPDALSVSTLIESTSEYCFDFEIKAIKAYETLHPNGYNLTTGGEGIHEMADVSKEKHRASMSSLERRKAVSKASLAYNSRPEVLDEKSRLMKQRWESKEWRKHMKMVAKAKRLEKSKENVVQKSCNFCNVFFSCSKKVSSYKLYCCRKCSSSASHEARKARNERY